MQVMLGNVIKDKPLTGERIEVDDAEIGPVSRAANVAEAVPVRCPFVAAVA